MNQEEQNNRLLHASKGAKIYASIDTNKALRKTKKNLNLKEDRRRVIPIFSSLLKVAASVAVIMAVSWIIYENYTRSGWNEVASGEQIKEYKLPDGSIVTLNRNARLRVKSDMSSNREVELEGEAFFKVARDEKRPFIIGTEGLMVEVLGTSFNVASDDRTTSVSVVFGKVRLSEKGNITNAQVLVKDESALYDNVSRQLKATTLDLNDLSWKTGILTFSNAPVTQALLALANHYGKKIAFEDEEILGTCTITAVFDNQSWSEIIEEISLIHSIGFGVQNDTIIVSGGNCSNNPVKP